MAEENELPALESVTRPRKRLLPLLLAGLLLVVGLALAYAWLSRKTIAGDYIADQLQEIGLSGTYEVAEIGPDEQVIRNLVIGDPERPDLTIAEVRIATRLGFGLPGLGRITLLRPRLYGRSEGGRVSFGSLDKALYTGGKEPFRLPDLDLAIIDGRALVQSPHGAFGFKLQGKGALRDGFAGEIAAIAPRLEVDGCAVTGASAYGRLSVEAERPHFSGPLRVRHVECSGPDLRWAEGAVEMDVTLAPALDEGEGQLTLASGAAELDSNRVASLAGTAKFTYRKQQLTARYDIAAKNLRTPEISAGRLGLSGRLRAGQSLSRVQLEGDVEGSDLTAGTVLDQTLARGQQSAEGTLFAPLLAQIRSGLTAEMRGSKLDGSFFARRAENGLSLVVPRISLRGRSGQALLAASRVQVLTKAAALASVSGNYATGGKGLPRIAGRMERSDSGKLVVHMQMPVYRAANSSLAVSELTVTQAPSGGLSFTGEVLLNGTLPGGHAEKLMLPLDGTWSGGSLALWHTCKRVQFDGLSFANLSLDRRHLTICPAPGRPLVRVASGSLSVTGGVSALDLTGRLGGTPIRIASGPVGFAYPGVIAARSVDVSLGPPDTASRFRIANLTARAERELAGTFDGSDVALHAVPLDLQNMSGNWRYAGGVLTLDDGILRLEDREQVDRFQPLVAREARLTLKNDRIDAQALLREPRTERPVVLATIRHDLATARGRADLNAQAITFDADLQPETLTRLALGIVANTEGTLRGRGRIDWDEAGVTSTGTISTDELDFAAAFGPVQGVSGTIRFTDLLGLVTAPGQRLRVASINPGIEVNNGVIAFALRPGHIIDVQGGQWPFVGGILRLLPTHMAIGTEDVQRYTLEVTGADAALFVQRLGIANLNATGIFDGTLPLVFDQNGGRVVGGLLSSRPPGGNLSYVGELTYKDLSAMANFAFDALRSLDYRQMTIGMDGAIEGEIVTRLQFSGVTQGEGASRNFITRRIGKLPIQFNVNLRAPFFQLITSFKSLYDPAYVRDPRSLGLLDASGRPIPRLQTPRVTMDSPASVQPSVSETVP